VSVLRPRRQRALAGLLVLGLLPVLHGVIASAAGRSLPPVNGRFDYQIGGAYVPSPSVAIVDRDRGASPVKGRYNICYVNVFQTQPEEAAWWKAHHADLLLRKPSGAYVGDPGWPGELLLDTSTAAKRSAIAAIEDGWVDGCATAGYRAVEPDNLDSYTRSGGQLTKADNVALAALLAAHSHGRRLAFAQKNDTDITAGDKAEVGFDFAIAEECGYYAECSAYTALYGREVIEIEYTDNGRAAFTAACAARGSSLSVIYRDRDVVPKGSSGYRYESC
jgi:hypothetical protein